MCRLQEIQICPSYRKSAGKPKPTEISIKYPESYLSSSWNSIIYRSFSDPAKRETSFAEDISLLSPLQEWFDKRSASTAQIRGQEGLPKYEQVNLHLLAP